MSKVNQDVLDLSAKYRAGITIEVKDGQAVTTVADAMFMSNLTEAEAAAIKVADHAKSTAFPAFTHAFGQASEEFLKKNKKIEAVSAELKLSGKDTWAVNYKRSEETTNPFDKSAAPVTKYGVVTAKLTTHDARPKIGQLKAVIDEIGVSALAAFGK